ncbi:hypothetical protein HYDPIDRAFT_27263 [Hydnomerulius pinastri MD-312]|nr:hypothetical protein HYDPIDRAFT_27263 [Hydnomerulius pinastri MD-312]
MDATRYRAMDAQRYDPMRRKNLHPNFAINTSKKDMGQFLRKVSPPSPPASEAVGGIWSDHELVLVPIEVSPTRDSEASIFSDSESDSTSRSSASSSSAESSSSYFTTPSATAEGDSENSCPSGSRQVDVFDRDDLIITRTIIRPSPQSPIKGLFSRPSSPISSRPGSSLCRPTSPILQALNCFSTSAFERDVDDVQAERANQMARQPVLQVIVTQTREQYEQDMAFKELVQEVYPEAGPHRRAH